MPSWCNASLVPSPSCLHFCERCVHSFVFASDTSTVHKLSEASSASYQPKPFLGHALLLSVWPHRTCFSTVSFTSYSIACIKLLKMRKDWRTRKKNNVKCSASRKGIKVQHFSLDHHNTPLPGPHLRPRCCHHLWRALDTPPGIRGTLLPLAWCRRSLPGLAGVWWTCLHALALAFQFWKCFFSFLFSSVSRAFFSCPLGTLLVYSFIDSACLCCGPARGQCHAQCWWAEMERGSSCSSNARGGSMEPRGVVPGWAGQ